jgi:hypothetical protein
LRDKAMAAADPAGPAPTMATSKRSMIILKRK